MSTKLKAHLALLAVALIYGANYSIAKQVLSNGYIPPSAFIVLRAIAALFLFVLVDFFFVKNKHQFDVQAEGPLIFGEIARADVLRLVACGVFGVAVNQLSFFHGLKLTTPINASLILTTTPILVLMLSAFVLNERIGAKKLTGILLGASGAVLLIIYGKKIAYNNDGLVGDLLVLLNSLSYGIYLVIVKKLMNRYHPFTLVKWVFAVGFLLVLPFGAQELTTVDWASFPASIWWAVAYVLICTSFLTYLFNAYALSKVNASVVGSYIYLQPFIAAAIAISVGMDALSAIKVAAGILIFIGVYLVSGK